MAVSTKTKQTHSGKDSQAAKSSRSSKQNTTRSTNGTRNESQNQTNRQSTNGTSTRETGKRVSTVVQAATTQVARQLTPALTNTQRTFDDLGAHIAFTIPVQLGAIPGDITLTT